MRFFLLFSFSILLSCSPKYHVSMMEVSSLSVKDSLVAGDSAMLSEISPYKNKLDETMNEVLNISEIAMTKQSPEGLLGNFVADLILQKANEYYVGEEKIKICILNSGGLRASLPKGEITRGRVYELMPFENELTVVTLNGEQAFQLFNYLASSGGAPVSGLSLGIANGLPVEMKVDGKPFDFTQNYTVVTSDYLANGGDKYFFFRNPLKREDLGVKVRDAIIEFIWEEKKQGRTLNTRLDRRIYHVN